MYLAVVVLFLFAMSWSLLCLKLTYQMLSHVHYFD